MDENIVISIARQYGSGSTVGKMLAEKLGISFYDKEIIRMASDESGIDLKLFGKVEGGDSVKPSLFGKSNLQRQASPAGQQRFYFRRKYFLAIRLKL